MRIHKFGTESETGWLTSKQTCRAPGQRKAFVHSKLSKKFTIYSSTQSEQLGLSSIAICKQCKLFELKPASEGFGTSKEPL